MDIPERFADVSLAQWLGVLPSELSRLSSLLNVRAPSLLSGRRLG
jgi:hypothetical protein